jgi:DNA-binding IscR family transcriptional regulator
VTRLRALADLARTHEGVLRLDEAARVLQLPPPQVEPLLSSLVDGDRVKLDVEDDGALVYRFRDWMPPERQLPGK